MSESQEVILAKLQEAVQGLSNREAEHHAAVLAELKDIKENINPRLTSLEQKLFTKGDFSEFYKSYVKELETVEQDYNKKIDAQAVEIETLKTKQNTWSGGLSVVVAILTLLIGILTKKYL